ncbi:MAG: type II toxin-antitoxin system PemK/MazF family toxin [Acidobacteria bacterium]|nr:type II toxin-antitoxin system PemK/MazF family toxin [Acidobacteriota bacterium]
MVKERTANAEQYEVYLVNLDPTVGHEIKKSRPCIIVSPNEMNILNTVIIAPMTTALRDFPFRVNIHFDDKDGQVALDQIRCIDKARLIKKVGVIDIVSADEISKTLVEIFSN